jgi:transposase-like protein
VRRKYNVGRAVQQLWVFGAYEVTTKKGFLVNVPDRTKETLMAVIKARINPGSIVVSDLWAAYNTISYEGYENLTVNHKYNFLDPRTYATTNHVESDWQKVKQKHKERYGTHRNMVASCLAEFMWRQRYGKSLDCFFSHIKDVYPLD